VDHAPPRRYDRDREGGMIAVGAVALYVLLLAGMLVYGLNSVLLVVVHRFMPEKHSVTRIETTRMIVPFVTVQLPVYNEANVVGRLLDAVGALEWPRDRLQVQVLDDSTDDTPEIAARHIARLRDLGVDVTHVRRTDRVEFKAGALREGLATARGEWIAIFDADFVPPPEFLQRAAAQFGDPHLACVQGRWTHLNRCWSPLTRVQALAIDGHFGVEQAARARAGWCLSFNGTAGVWRRAAIDAAGGWSGDTLTEDLDLSYRAQLAGWRIAYDPDLVCPAELPTQLAAFKAQQRRWATGSIQTARKLLPAIWRARRSLATKVQATLHLTHYAIHPLIAATALLSVPCVLLPGAAADQQNLWMLLLPFAIAMSGPSLLYLYARRALNVRSPRPYVDLALLTIVGVGIALSNGRAVWDALRGGRRPFERTPKLGVVRRGDAPLRRYRVREDRLARLELALGAYCLAAAVGLLWTGVYVLAPFLLLDAMGLGYVAATGLIEARA